MTEIKIMSATRSEFYRSLGHFKPDHTVSENALTFSLNLNSGRVNFQLQDLPRRRVTGLLSLPQLEVKLDFDDVGDADRAKFLQDFDLAFRRGGG